MVMMKASEIKESVNQLQQLQWKEQGEEEDHAKEGAMSLERT
jgi:hypothetical protein